MTQPDPQEVAKLVETSGLSEEAVRGVLAAQQAQQEGEPVHTVRRQVHNGDIAHRVKHEGSIKWRVSQAEGDVSYIIAPTLTSDWELLSAPE